MARKRTSQILIIAMGFLLVACGPSQAVLDATSTQISADIFATQTALAPTPTETATPTPIPSPTQTPTTRPEPSEATITLADLPTSFDEMPAEIVDDLKSDLTGDPYPAEAVFAFWDIGGPEFLIGFTTIVATEDDQAQLDSVLSTFTEFFLRGMTSVFGASLSQEIETLSPLEGIGELAVGVTTVVEYRDDPLRFDVIGFRRETIAAWVVHIYIDGAQTNVSVDEVARRLDGHILDNLHAESPDATPAYSFNLDLEVVDAYWNEDGSLSLAYEFVFTNDALAAPIDYVDIGIPSEHYTIENASAEVDGLPITQIAESTFLSGSLELGLGDNAIPPGETGTVSFRIHGIQSVLVANPDGEPFAHAIFAPTFFSPEFVHGVTDFQVRFHLPPGVQADEARWHTAPSGWPEEPTLDVDEQGRLTAVWNNPQANGHTQYVFVVSFPKVYVPESALVRQ